MQAPQVKEPDDKLANLSQRPSNVLWSLLFCIILPMVILNKLSGEDYLGVKLSIIVAFLFPLTYGIKEFLASSKIDLFSVLGVVSVPLTGGLSLLAVDAIYIAIKEAAIPGILGFAILLSLRTPAPFIHSFFKNSSLINTQAFAQALDKNQCHEAFNILLKKSTWLLSGSFFLSSMLNFFLAVFVLTASPGTELFNQQLGRMLALSFPINAVPPMLVNIANLIYVSKAIKRLTGLSLEEIINIK
jgi:hypothetical protein